MYNIFSPKWLCLTTAHGKLGRFFYFSSNELLTILCPNLRVACFMLIEFKIFNSLFPVQLKRQTKEGASITPEYQKLAVA